MKTKGLSHQQARSALQTSPADHHGYMVHIIASYDASGRKLSVYIPTGNLKILTQLISWPRNGGTSLSDSICCVLYSTPISVYPPSKILPTIPRVQGCCGMDKCLSLEFATQVTTSAGKTIKCQVELAGFFIVSGALHNSFCCYHRFYLLSAKAATFHISLHFFSFANKPHTQSNGIRK